MRKTIKSLLFAVLVLSSWNAFSQTMTLKPGAAIGEDAMILTTHGCTPTGWSSPGEVANTDPSQLAITAWTLNAGGCPNMEMRSLIRFSEMSQLCKNATIDYAELRLYGVPNSAMAPQGNSHYPGSPYLAWGPDNLGWVQRVTSGWAEGTVTWNTQPSTTTTNQQVIPTSTLQWNDNYAIDVTPLVQDIVASGVNDGFMLRLQSETIYKNILWASSDDANSALWPELYIEYHCCNPNFTYCSSTQYPNTWTFTADDPTQPYTYKWDFGDGFGATGTSVTHTYMTPGAYKVCLYLIDKGGKVVCERCTEICIREIVEPPKDGEGAQNKQSDNSSNTLAVTKAANVVLDGTLAITSVYPNPAHTNIEVNVHLVKGGNVDYKVYSIAGKELMSGKRPMEKGAQSLSISIEKLPPGTYILEMKDQYSQVKHKFSKE